MRILLILTALLTCTFVVHGQERLFAVGFGKTFVSDDSTNLSFNLDLNRIPGKSEGGGGFFFMNRNLGASRWRMYIKPTLDINIGSGVSSAPNNISVGTPIGFAYDFEQGQKKLGLLSFFIELAPEIVADKTMAGALYYLSASPYIKYSFVDRVEIDLLTGVSMANGSRDQPETDLEYYGRFTVPFYLKFKAIQGVAKKGKPDEKKFKRLCLTTSVKYNRILEDDKVITPEDTYWFCNTKLDIYITPNLGLNLTYNNGHEEPLFKRNNAISVGIVLAR